MIRSPKPDPSIRAVELELATLRNIEALLGHAINLLHDAEKFAEQIRYVAAPLIKANGETLKDHVLPVVRESIVRHEKKVREG